MFKQVLSKRAEKSLAILEQSNLLKNSYLAGGTGLALQIGHRYSYDLDFFTKEEFDEKMMVQRIKKIIPEFSVEKTSWRTILGSIKDFKFSLFFYEYPLLEKARNFYGINIADIKDITAMKISAISNRGTKKDFIDLYFILSVKNFFSIKEALNLYDDKFTDLKTNKIHIIKSLNYFKDADSNPMPRMIENIYWNDVKKYFKKEIKKISKDLFDL